MKNRRKIGRMLLFCISAVTLSGCQTSVTEQNQITTEENEYESETENDRQAYETEFANSTGEQEKINDNTDELYISQIEAESSAADKEWQKCDLPQEEWPDYYFFKNAQQGHYNLSLENEVAFAVKDYAKDAGLENEQWELKQIFHWSDDIYQAYTESDMGSELYIILKADTPEVLPYYIIAADIRKGDAAAAILYEEYSYNSALEWHSYEDWFDGKKTADEKQLSLNAIDELYDSIYSNEAYWAVCDYLDRMDGNESDQWEINSNSTYIGRNGYIACVSCSNGVKDVLFFVDVWNKTYAIWK